MLTHITFKYISRLTKCLIALSVIIVILYVNSYSSPPNNIHESTTYSSKYRQNRGKYILLWTDPNASPFNYFGKGSSIFKRKKCKYTNCYVTGNRTELGDSSLFDAVLFNGPQLNKMVALQDFPTTRSIGQKFVYANVESAQNYPVSKEFNGFFNWTWTYRLDSDAQWGYFVVKNKTGQVVAPNVKVKWRRVEFLKDIDGKLKKKLRSKKIAAAWFASNCHTKSQREDFVALTRDYLRKYKLDVHIYGACGDHHCPTFINEKCLKYLEKDYYFYFAFENSFSDDYVTEKVLNAYKHNIVPVVYGSANYTRFLPPGSYLDAYKLGPKKLAVLMRDIIKSRAYYHKYFRWTNYYTFHYRHESPQTDDYCKFCEVLNDVTLFDTISIHRDLDVWWNVDKNAFKLFSKAATLWFS